MRGTAVAFCAASTRSRNNAWLRFAHDIARHDARLEDVMSLMLTRLRAFARNDEGQDLIEYALLVALIAVICVGAVTFAGQQVLAIFTSIGNSLAAAL